MSMHKYWVKKGFSLIELVVVIAVLSIITSLVTVAGIAIAKSSREKNAKSEIKAYYTLCMTAMGQLNSGSSIYGNGVNTTNSDVMTLLKQITGTEPKYCFKLEDADSPLLIRPTINMENGYYVAYRFGDPHVIYPSKKSIDNADKQWFIEAVFYLNDGIRFEYLRNSSEVTVTK